MQFANPAGCFLFCAADICQIIINEVGLDAIALLKRTIAIPSRSAPYKSAQQLHIKCNSQILRVAFYFAYAIVFLIKFKAADISAAFDVSPLAYIAYLYKI